MEVVNDNWSHEMSDSRLEVSSQWQRVHTQLGALSVVEVFAPFWRGTARSQAVTGKTAVQRYWVVAETAQAAKDTARAVCRYPRPELTAKEVETPPESIDYLHFASDSDIPHREKAKTYVLAEVVIETATAEGLGVEWRWAGRERASARVHWRVGELWIPERAYDGKLKLGVGNKAQVFALSEPDSLERIAALMRFMETGK